MKIKPILAIAAFAAALCAGAQADTYAFLMGINDYPEPVDASGKPILDKNGNAVTDDLKGCVNDVNDMKAMLLSKFGVPEGNIRMATDGAATEQGFVDGMKWLIQSAKPGDQIIFHYAGHGSQVKGEKTDSDPDGLDEVIVLADEKLVADKLFASLGKGLANKGLNVTFIFDSCHSGGMSRDPNPNVVLKTRAMDISKSRKARSFSATQVAGLQAAARGVVTGTGQEKGSYAFLFGCKEDQTSSDLSFKDNSKPAHGLFTLALTLTLGQHPDWNLEKLETELAATIKELKFKQVPNFEYSSSGRANKPLIWN